MRNKIVHYLYLLISICLIGLLFNGCTKEVDNTLVETKTFMHVYPEQGGQYCNYMKATDDGGCMLFVNEDLRAFGDGKKLAIIKLNEKGGIEWKRTVTDYELPSLSLCTPLKDGSFLFTADGTAGKIVKVGKDGEVQFVTDFSYIFPQPPAINRYNSGYPVEGYDGHYRVAFTDGTSRYNANAYVAEFNSDGSFMGTREIKEANFGLDQFKLLTLSIYKYGSGPTYFFMGAAFMHGDNNFSWSERAKLFLSKQLYWEDSTSTTNLQSKTVWIDSLIGDNALQSYWQKYTEDRQLIITTTVADINNINKGQLIKANDDLDILWKTDIKVSPYGTALNSGIEICKDGNYFLTGTCKIPGKISDQPFAVKVDPNGHVLWYTIFQTNLNSNLSYGLETVKGDYVLTGTTTGFGAGNTGADLFIIKADKNLNYKE